jgi:putative redox protein
MFLFENLMLYYAEFGGGIMENWRELTADWIGGSAFRTEASNGAEVIIGSNESIKGASPMEMLLMAKAGCTGIDIVNILDKKRQPVRDLRVRVRALRAHEYPKIWTEIEVEYLVWGNVEPSALEQAIHLSEEKYCSVGVMLGKAAKLRSSYQIFPLEANIENVE